MELKRCAALQPLECLKISLISFDSLQAVLAK